MNKRASGSARPSKRVTLADVATDAGVSRSTASLVLRGSPQISLETRSRVTASMERLGYVYHRGAASLRARRTQTVGLLAPDVSSPYFAELFTGLETVLAGEGIVTMMADTFEDTSRQELLLTAYMERLVDGLILLPAIGTRVETVRRLEAAGVPHVLAFRSVEGSKSAFVGFDNVIGGALAAEHLVWHGCRRIAYVGGMDGLIVRRDRVAGVQRRLVGTGASLVTDIPGPGTGAWGRECGRELADESLLDAIICHNDSLAFGVYRGLRDRAAEAVTSTRVVSFDDVDEAALWEPPLTSVAGPGRQVGLLAAQSLLRRLEYPSDATATTLLVPELRVRRSCGCSTDS